MGRQVGQLMSVREWKEKRFTEESRPSDRTLQRWTQNNYHGFFVKRFGKWFVDLDLEAANTGNELVDSVLGGE